MIYPWDDYISIGITTHSLALPDNDNFEKRVLEVTRLIAGDLFFNNLEIAEIKEDKLKKEFKKIIDMSHMDTIFGAGPTIFAEELDLNSFDSNIRKKTIKRIKGLIDMAYYFGSRKFAITSGLDVEPLKRIEAKKILIESIKEIGLYLLDQTPKGDSPIPLLLETFDRDYTHKMLIGPTDDAIEIITSVKKDYDNIKVMLDLGHQPLIGEDMDQAVEKTCNHIGHIHIGNCVIKDNNDPRFGDTHPYLGYPGGENGIKEITHFLETLQKNSYFKIGGNAGKLRELPTINFEVIRVNGDDPGMLITNIKRIFSKAWNMFCMNN